MTTRYFLRKGKTRRLYLVWAGFRKAGYTKGIAISASGQRAWIAALRAP
jgi:hypothetical protein